MSKVFPLTERVNIRLEGTFTNVLNHTNLGDPNMDISSPSFGQVTGVISTVAGSNGTFGDGAGGSRTGQVSARIDF